MTNNKRMSNHTGEMAIMNINSRRREQNLTSDADRSCESHHSLSRTRRVKRFPHSTSPLESASPSNQMDCLEFRSHTANFW